MPGTVSVQLWISAWMFGWLSRYECMNKIAVKPPPMRYSHKDLGWWGAIWTLTLLGFVLRESAYSEIALTHQALSTCLNDSIFYLHILIILGNVWPDNPWGWISLLGPQQNKYFVDTFSAWYKVQMGFESPLCHLCMIQGKLINLSEFHFHYL